MNQSIFFNSLRSGETLAIGDKFSFLTVLKRNQKKEPKKGSFYLCRCDCGKEKLINYCAFQSKRPTRSCGCMRKQLLREAKIIHGCSTKNNTSEYRTFISWQAMIWRCTNKNRKDYINYGGRGIKVSPRWNEFANFFNDMGTKPNGFSLGRKDNNKGYSRENCRWETNQQQARNKRTNRLISAFGKCKTLIEWAEEIGIARDTISKRISSGWSVVDALSIPTRSSRYMFP
tara:strand:+ start:65 stop:754 length:690 start_codon:yes stop_codon:yes gene_type:complete